MPTLSQPVTAHNLTAWFIVAPSADAGVELDYAVLEESIAGETALLHETGDVNELFVENTGDVDLFIQAGDIVKGGRQDRTIGVDFIVPARSGKVPLPAFCVEQSRWHRRDLESPVHFSKASDLIASKKALLAMRLAKSQRDVWQSVAEEQEMLAKSVQSEVRSVASPSSLQLTYENEHVTRAVEDYVTVLENAPAAAGGSVVGVVWAINGVPSHADRYASPALFAKLWRKLLRAAATEAIVQRPPQPAEGGDTPVPTATEIQDWLDARSAVGAGSQDEQLPPRTLLRTERGESRHRFEAFDTARPAAAAVHVAVLSQ